VTTATLGYTTTVQPKSDGTQRVTGTVNVVPSPQGAVTQPQPTSTSGATSVTVAFTVDPTAGTVTGETVNVQNAPAAISGAGVVGSVPTSAPTSASTTPTGASPPAGNVATAERSVGEVVDNFAVAGRPAAQTGV